MYLTFYGMTEIISLTRISSSSYVVYMKQMLSEIEERRAKRAFSGERVAKDVLERILLAGHLAPSCFNNQPWRFIIYDTDERIQKITKTLAPRNIWASKSSFLVVVVTDYEDDCKLSEKRDYALFDTGLAVENMMLQAVHEGLYAHPMAGFDPLAVKEVAGIPDSSIVVTLVAFGLPGDKALLDERSQKLEDAPRKRRPLEEILHYGRW